MIQCLVPNCKNKTKRHKEMNYCNDLISYHSFPKNQMMCQLWLDKLGIKDKNITSRSRVCSLHFGDDAFDRSRIKIRLKPTAVPNTSSGTEVKFIMNSPESADLNVDEFVSTLAPSLDHTYSLSSRIRSENGNKSSQISIKPLSQLRASTSTINVTPINVGINVPTFIDIGGMDYYDYPMDEEKIIVPHILADHDNFSSVQSPVIKVDKETMAPNFYNSSENLKLLNRIKLIESENEKTIRALREKLRRCNDQILYLRDKVLERWKHNLNLNGSEAEMEIKQILDIMCASIEQSDEEDSVDLHHVFSVS